MDDKWTELGRSLFILQSFCRSYWWSCIQLMEISIKPSSLFKILKCTLWAWLINIPNKVQKHVRRKTVGHEACSWFAKIVCANLNRRKEQCSNEIFGYAAVFRSFYTTPCCHSQLEGKLAQVFMMSLWQKIFLKNKKGVDIRVKSMVVKEWITWMPVNFPFCSRWINCIQAVYMCRCLLHAGALWETGGGDTLTAQGVSLSGNKGNKIDLTVRILAITPNLQREHQRRITQHSSKMHPA